MPETNKPQITKYTKEEIEEMATRQGCSVTEIKNYIKEQNKRIKKGMAI